MVDGKNKIVSKHLFKWCWKWISWFRQQFCLGWRIPVAVSTFSPRCARPKNDCWAHCSMDDWWAAFRLRLGLGTEELLRIFTRHFWTFVNSDRNESLPLPPNKQQVTFYKAGSLFVSRDKSSEVMAFAWGTSRPIMAPSSFSCWSSSPSGVTSWCVTSWCGDRYLEAASAAKFVFLSLLTVSKCQGNVRWLIWGA